MPVGPEPEVPPMNIALEDLLALAGYDRAGEILVLEAWIRLGVERLAREAGRRHARGYVDAMGEFVRESRPSPDWPQ